MPTTAAAVFAALKQSLAALEREQQNSVLHFAEILQRQLYRDLGYSSIWHLAMHGLGFSRSRTAQYIRLAKAVDRLPRLKAAVASGEVEWTKARELTRVATPQTEAAWVARARKSSRRRLAAEVRAACKPPTSQASLLEASAIPAADPPVRISFELDTLQLARYEKLMEVLRKQGRGDAATEILLEALGALADGECTREHTARPPYQVVVHHCERCGRVEAPTTRGTRRLEAAASGAVGCDHDRVDRDGVKRSAIPIRTRRLVLARDGHRCSAPGCTHTWFLHLHHVVPRAEGGANVPDNLVTLCSACHRIRHREQGTGMATCASQPTRKSACAEEPDGP